MMIVMLKMRVPVLGDFSMIFYWRKKNVCHFRPFVIGKTQCLRESGFKSYVLFDDDLEKQAWFDAPR